MVTVMLKKSNPNSKLILNVQAAGSRAGGSGFKNLTPGVPIDFDITPGVYDLEIIGFLSSGHEPFTLTLGNALFGKKGGAGSSVSLTAGSPVYKNLLKIVVNP